MNTYYSIHETFLRYYEIETDWQKLKSACNIKVPTHASVADFLELFLETGRLTGLVYVVNKLSKEEFEKSLQQSKFPFITFAQNNGKVEPALAFAGLHGMKLSFVSAPEQELAAGQLEFAIDDEKYYAVTCYPELARRQSFFDEPSGPFARLYRLLNIERRDILLIYLYAAVAGLISLSLPLGVQSIIGFAASGQLTTSIVVLVMFIVLGIMVTGGMQVMQLYLVEYMQRRIFARTTFEFAWKLPRIKVEALFKENVPELVNRFFDLLTLEKGLAKLLVEFSAAILQIVFGLLLLSFYHSSFIFLGLFLVVVLYLIIKLTGTQGMQSNLVSSQYKYKIAAWLEEIGRGYSTFRLYGYSNFSLEKTDSNLSEYLSARRAHFKILVIQYFSFIGFKTLITAGLLILGCILLIAREINIGEFVAAEIIIIMVMSAVEKVILQLDSVYDVLTSLEKLSAVTDLPIENSEGIYTEELQFDGPISVDIQQLSYTYPGAKRTAIDDVNLRLERREKVVIAGYEDAGRRTLSNVLLSMLENYDGTILLNEFSLKDLRRNSLMHRIGDTISQEDIFEGTIYENIMLGDERLDKHHLVEIMQVTGLDKIVNKLPEGLRSRVTQGVLGVQERVSKRILLTRSLIKKPGLLVLDDHFSEMNPSEVDRIMKYLTRPEAPWTLIVLTNDPVIMNYCERVIVMQKGRVVLDAASGDARINQVLNGI